jgi:chaperone modulatory protein CbpM
MTRTVLTGVVLDERTELTIDEFCEACSTSTRWVFELVEEGVVEPVCQDEGEWRFSGASLVRARAARRLQHDLDLNLQGVALALDLMDEIRDLREKLRRLEGGERT